jgi:hypothetical protein
MEYIIFALNSRIPLTPVLHLGFDRQEFSFQTAYNDRISEDQRRVNGGIPLPRQSSRSDVWPGGVRRNRDAWTSIYSKGPCGDKATNAAIAVTLLGAVHGRAAVPPRWARAILVCRPGPGRPCVSLIVQWRRIPHQGEAVPRAESPLLTQISQMDADYADCFNLRIRRKFA